MSKVEISLLETMAKKGVTPRELELESGLSRHAINSMMNGDVQRVDFRVLAKLCDALDCEIQDLMQVKRPAAEGR
ncbi:putative transcriptional regulator [Salsuginibacillus halophilus]|uniref:Putative transcriptional regulator n=1 Tax=Salsuginibacillus halophilus TaxID=517424 RepID=A0A2P8H683_9BACI|nr:helix-turn-helix transcriptional regulator [Salsuginibacillus halophilus]PSL41737.1 putative transcriptional regulator [Salsuginibacillus halophilus]